MGIVDVPSVDLEAEKKREYGERKGILSQK
jgi:hypothetical protein